MKKIVTASSVILVLLSRVSFAGVAMDLVTTDAKGEETGRLNIFSQAGDIRMDDEGSGSRNSMIFLGDRFLVLDHKDKSYVVMDEAMVNEVSAQMNEAMQEMEKQLASLPPEQRAMAEQMMKRQMGGMMGQKEGPPPLRVEALGNGKWETYDCEKFAVYQGAEKTQEVCAAPLNDIEGAAEMMQAFRGMAKFMNKMTESMPMRSSQGMNPGELMKQIEGFPIYTLDFRNGELAGATSLESVAAQDLDDVLFTVPDGYEQQDPMRRR